MKGNQGLEALAALCGGASKATGVGEMVSSLSQAASAGAAPGTTPSESARLHAAALLAARARAGDVPTAAASASSPSTSPGPSSQQWQQAVAAATAAYGGLPTAQTTAAVNAILSASGLAAPPPQPQPQPNPTGDAASAVQQIAYYHYLQAQANTAAQAAKIAQQQQDPTFVSASPASSAFFDPSAAVALALAAHQSASQQSVSAARIPQQQQQHQQQQAPKTLSQKPQILPSSAQASSQQQILPGPQQASQSATTSAAQAPGSMQPPLPPHQLSPGATALSTNYLSASASASPRVALAPQPRRTAGGGAAEVPTRQQPQPLAPSVAPQSRAAPRPAASVSVDVETSSASSTKAISVEDKKQLKRAANRRSAQLSRKRKKVFIEELKDENDELRRKEQILRSIPDLIVVFDSSGKIGFVSQSVSRFLDFTPKELESSSFWDRLCDESVRLLKAAFMDALAAKNQGMDTTPLGSGVWELRLVDRDGTHKVVTLNGVVHFAGESPECVCSIRPVDQKDEANTTQQQKLTASSAVSMSTSSAAANAMQLQRSSLVRSAIKPQQSVISNGSDESSIKLAQGKASLALAAPAAGSAGRAAAAGGSTRRGLRAAQISDGDSIVSESGSDEQ